MTAAQETSDLGNREALHRLGALRLQEERFADAEALLRRAALGSDDPAAWYHLGLALEHRSRPDAAAAAYRRALAAWPEFPEAAANLANLVMGEGRPDAAAVLYRNALAIRPGDVVALSNLGLALVERGRPEEAAAAYRRALAIEPLHAEVIHNLSLALGALRRPEEAAAASRRTLALRPDYAPAHWSYGSARRQQDRAAEADGACRRALALRPDFPEALCDLAVGRQLEARCDEAMTLHGRALRLRPDFADAHWNLALALLLLGRMEEGWAEYEWRWRRAEFIANHRAFSQPLWDGAASDGGVLLLRPEQGLGDAIQFARYVPAVRRRGWRVVLEVPRPLLRLFAAFPAADPGVTLVACGDPLPPFDAHCPLMSLPHRFGTTLETIPADIPYLAADPKEVAAWRARLAGPPGLTVGFVWAGNPHHSNDRNRSLPAAALAPLLARPGVRPFSLQFGHAARDVDGLPPYHGDFADAAAALTALDLLVTVDTSIAHLAGALGRPAWLLLSFAPDWRWLQERDDSPWYPSLRLFRQTRPGDWKDVIARVERELARLT